MLRSLAFALLALSALLPQLSSARSRIPSDHSPTLLQPTIPIGNPGVAYLVTVLAEHRRQIEALAVPLGRGVVLVIAVRLGLATHRASR